MPKKPTVYFVRHTHWNREWYFTSDDSRTLLYYHLKYLIENLEKSSRDTFTFDGQSVIVDDFLRFAPDWRARLKKVVKSRKLLIGPFYTQMDNYQARGEALVRNLEIGIDLAQQMGHAMKVGYLPDVFCHSQQTSQILRMNGIDNFLFSRGINPSLINNNLYFWLQSPDGSKVFSTWLTDYASHPNTLGANLNEWVAYLVEDHPQPGQFHPSIKSYLKRNQELPIMVPVGADQHPYQPEVRQLVSRLKSQYQEWNLELGDFEGALAKIKHVLKRQNTLLPTVDTPLKEGVTKPVHRAVASTRIDLKQLYYELESLLIDMIEPMSVMCQIEKIDVPWAMIELIWKQYLKSAAYHSYAGVGIDSVSQKNRQRLTSAIRLGRNVLAMLSRIFAQRFIREEIDAYQKLILFNYDLKIYEGPYEIKINVKDNRQIGQFSFWDQDTPIKFSIIKTYPDHSYLILLHEVRIPAFNYKLIGVKYHEKPRALPPLENFVRNDYLEVRVGRRGLTLTKGNKTWTNFWQICAYPSAGDTFTHAPLKEVDRAYFFDEFKVLASDAHHQSLRVIASGFVPSGIENWSAGKEAQRQNVEINIVLIEERVFFQVNLTNALQDTRLVVLVDANSGEDRWWHDQVFGLEENQINPAGLDTLEKPDSFGYRRPEYLGNQSVHHHFVANYQNTATIFTQGTREHELLVWEGKHYFAFTLLRSFSKISAKKLAWRTGPSPMAESPSADCQLSQSKLHYSFIVDYNYRTIAQQFQNAKHLFYKNYYLPNPSQWAQPLFHWKSNLAHYDRGQREDPYTWQIPALIENENLIVSAFYRNPRRQIILRILNVGPSFTFTDTSLRCSRTLSNFRHQKLFWPQWGLVNFLI